MKHLMGHINNVYQKGQAVHSLVKQVMLKESDLIRLYNSALWAG